MPFEFKMMVQPDSIDGSPLFASGRDWRNNACVESYGSFYAYVEGYRLAADLIVQSVMDGGRSQDLLVYPAAFLYRQYLELSLKDMIQSGRQLVDAGDDSPHGHRLNYLWQEVKRVFGCVDGLSPIPDVALIDRIIAEFDALDPGSTAFRYPLN